MKINEIITERAGQQRVVIMYHGTSSTFLPSIQKFGLDPNPLKKSFYFSDAWQSYGGIYLTTSKQMAKAASDAAVGRHGGEPILITVQYVLGSGGLDEDNANQFILLSFIHASMAHEFTKYVVDAFLSVYGITYPKGSYQDFKNLFSLMSNRTINLLHDDPDFGDWTEHEFVNKMMIDSKYHHVFMGYPQYRDLVKKIIEKAKVTNTPHTDSLDSNGELDATQFTNVRVTRPIKFRGKTRIIDISKI